MLNSQCALAKPVNANKILHRVLVCLFMHGASRLYQYSMKYFTLQVVAIASQALFCLPQQGRQMVVSPYMRMHATGLPRFGSLSFRFSLSLESLFVGRRGSSNAFVYPWAAGSPQMWSSMSADFFRCILCGDACLFRGARFAYAHSKSLEAFGSRPRSLGFRQLLPVRFSQQCDSSCRQFFVGWICGGSGSYYSQSTQERPSGVFLALA